MASRATSEAVKVGSVMEAAGDATMMRWEQVD
jgi:hypothetical protein